MARRQSEAVSEAPAQYEPTWGADGWPRPTASGLDEGDLQLIESMLRLTPRERVESLRRQGLATARRVEPVRPD